MNQELLSLIALIDFSKGFLLRALETVYLIQIPLNILIAIVLLKTTGRAIYKLIAFWFIFQTAEYIWRIQSLKGYEDIPLTPPRASILIVLIFQIFVSIFILMVTTRELKIFNRAVTRLRGKEYGNR